jgi:hypothetical protein
MSMMMGREVLMENKEIYCSVVTTYIYFFTFSHITNKICPSPHTSSCIVSSASSRYVA